MRSDRTRNIVILAIWLFIGSIAGYFFYEGIVQGGISFEPKHDGEPTIVLYDVTLDESVKSITIDWISGGVKIIPTIDNRIRIVEKSYELVERTKWATVSVTGTALTIESKNKPLFFFMGLMTRSTYLEVYLPITTSLDSVKLVGVSGNYSIDELYSELTKITLTSGNLTIDNSYTGLLSLTMTSGNSTITDSQILSASITMTSGRLDYQADTINFNADMTSGLADITFGNTNPESLSLSMTSGSCTINLKEQSAFSVSVDKSSGSFNPNFTHVKNGKVYIYLSGGPTYDIDLTSGTVDFNLIGQ
jgi:DUF4097 and DUF4098 domain-containing protein YvlB